VPESQERFYYISPDGKLVPVSSVGEALSMAQSGGYIWLDYRQPPRQALEALIEPLGIHPLSVEDSLDVDQIPKIDAFPTNNFLIFNYFEYIGGHLLIHEVDLFIGNTFLITISGHHAEDHWPLGGIERIVERSMSSIKQGPDFLLHVVLDYVVDEKYKAIESLEDSLDTAEETILASPAGFHPEGLLDLRRDLLSVRKSLFHEREILVKICRRDSAYISEQAIYRFRDIYDHLTKFFELTEACRDIVTSLMEIYLSMINNQMSKTANETNATMRRLTLITTIFMPLTFLTGLGGMSEFSMMTGPENWRFTYPAFLVAMILIAIADYFLIRWYERRMRRRAAQTAIQ
jgi:magnesium transporter